MLIETVMISKLPDFYLHACTLLVNPVSPFMDIETNFPFYFYSLLKVLAVLTLFVHPNTADLNDANYMAANLKIAFNMVDNYPSDGIGLLAMVEITNEGTNDITDKNWVIYMPSIRYLSSITFREVIHAVNTETTIYKD